MVNYSKQHIVVSFKIKVWIQEKTNNLDPKANMAWFNYLNLMNIGGIVVVLYKVNMDQALNIKIFKNSY